MIPSSQHVLSIVLLCFTLPCSANASVSPPTVTKILGSPVYLDDLKTAGKMTVTLQGTGLDSVIGVNLILSGTTLSYKPQAATPADPTKLQFEID